MHTHMPVLTYSDTYLLISMCTPCIDAAPRDSNVTSESWTSLSSAMAIFLGKRLGSAKDQNLWIQWN